MGRAQNFKNLERYTVIGLVVSSRQGRRWFEGEGVDQGSCVGEEERGCVGAATRSARASYSPRYARPLFNFFFYYSYLETRPFTSLCEGADT